MEGISISRALVMEDGHNCMGLGKSKKTSSNQTELEHKEGWLNSEDCVGERSLRR